MCKDIKPSWLATPRHNADAVRRFGAEIPRLHGGRTSTYADTYNNLSHRYKVKAGNGAIRYLLSDLFTLPCRHIAFEDPEQH